MYKHHVVVLLVHMHQQRRLLYIQNELCFALILFCYFRNIQPTVRSIQNYKNKQSRQNKKPMRDILICTRAHENLYWKMPLLIKYKKKNSWFNKHGNYYDSQLQLIKNRCDSTTRHNNINDIFYAESSSSNTGITFSY